MKEFLQFVPIFYSYFLYINLSGPFMALMRRDIGARKEISLLPSLAFTQTIVPPKGI